LTGVPELSPFVIAKGKTSQSWWRKATGPRFLCDIRLEDPKIAGLPRRLI
jgi:hypothetical protein